MDCDCNDIAFLSNLLTLSQPRGYYAEKDEKTLTGTRAVKKAPECMTFGNIGKRYEK